MSDKIVDRTGLKAFRQKLDDKYVIEGEYSPETSVGKADVADNLSAYGPNSGATDNTPFVFQSSGGGSDIGRLAQLKSLRGNTIVWNQLAKLATISETTTNDITYSRTTTKATFGGTANADTNITLIAANVSVDYDNTHKFLIKWNFKGTAIDNNLVYSNVFGRQTSIADQIVSNVQNTNTYCQITIKNTTSVDFSVEPQIFDLTQMFGAGNEPESVVDFNRLFPEPYYDFNAGELKSCQSSAYKTVGYNAFDGELEGGAIDLTTGQNINNNNNFRTKNYTKVIAGQTYTSEFNYSNLGGSMYLFEYDNSYNFIKYSSVTLSGLLTVVLSNSTHYIRIQWYKNNSGWKDNVPTNANVCFHLTWDESKTGYEPYEVHNYALPNIELKSAGNVYDEITPDGNLIRRVGSVDLGTLDFAYQGVFQQGFGVYLSDGIGSAIGIKANALCAKYKTVRTGGTDLNIDKSIRLHYVNASYPCLIEIIDSDYTDVATFKQAMSGVYLYYELKEPTTTQSDSYKYLENTAIDDWGTQEFVGNGIPQGNDFFYIVDYKAFIDSLGERQDIEYDASEIVSHSELTTALSNIDLNDYAKKDQAFNVIDASDITTSSITADQIAIFTNGKQTRINGTLLNIVNPTFLPFYQSGATYFSKVYGISTAGIAIDSICYIYNNELALDTGKIEYGLSANYIDINKLRKVNNKTIPAYPNNPTTPQAFIYDTDNLLKYTNASGFKQITYDDYQALSDAEQNELLDKGCCIIGTVGTGTNAVRNPILYPAHNYGSYRQGIMIGDYNASSGGAPFIGSWEKISQATTINTRASNGGIKISDSKVGSINGISINQFYKKPQESVTVTNGGTITDNTLKTLIQNEQPIKLNGYTGYFSYDDGTNYQYHSIIFDSANNVNHLNVVTINKSTWVVTFHTSNFALN